MKTAIITGTSSGIGKETALMLLNENYKVIGFSRTASGIENQNFTEFLMCLTNTAILTEKIKNIIKKTDVDVLINNAGVGYYGPHEQLSPSMIHEMATVNFEVPLLITSLLLRNLKKTHGIIINMSSVTACRRDNTHGAAYGATKAGLSSFGDSLFAEVRKYGVRVANIHPDMTDTSLYRNADFGPSDEEGCFLTPHDVASTVLSVIKMPAGTNIQNVTITPQFHRISRKDSSGGCNDIKKK